MSREQRPRRRRSCVRCWLRLAAFVAHSLHFSTAVHTGSLSVSAALGRHDANVRHALRARHHSRYSNVNGTLDVGSCDKHMLCRDILALYQDQQLFCPPSNVFCQKVRAFRCTGQSSVYEKWNCGFEDCLDVRSMLVSENSCIEWFPEIAETAANRNPVEDLPNPTKVRACVF